METLRRQGLELLIAQVAEVVGFQRVAGGALQLGGEGEELVSHGFQ